MKPRPPSRLSHGFALILTLIFVTLITIVIVGFLTSMKLEAVSADMHLRGTQAELFTQMGLNAGAARIRQAWNAVATNGYAASGPGWFFASTPSASGGPQGQLYDLSSGSASASATTDQAADLNMALAGNSQGGIAVTNTPMLASWIYVLQNGTLTNSPPAYLPGNAANAPVGRFAFWTDDESAKINVNTALTRNSATNADSPSQINLESVFPGQSTNIGFYRTLTNYFASPADIRQVNPTVSALAETNAFALTPYNHTSNLNMFGQPRIMLTTQQSLAGTNQFLDILATPNADPGAIANLSATKLNTVIEQLAAYLNRTDWPLLTGKSFASKFSPVRPEQIAINIIEYVRARESAQALVEPIRGLLANGAFTLNTAANPASNASTSASAISGNTRGVKITEFGFYLTNGTAPGQYWLQLVLELYLPTYAGLTSVNLSTVAVSYDVAPAATLLTYKSSPSSSSIAPNSPVQITSAMVAGGNLTLNAGQYCKVTIPSQFQLTFNSPNTAASLTSAYMAVALAPSSGTGGRLDYVVNQLYNVSVAGIMGPDTQISSVASDDPYNRSYSNWYQEAPAKVTWGAVNSCSTLGKSSIISPQQDTDSNGLITDVSMSFPPPKGQPGNLTGIMQSVAELGYVQTGFESEQQQASPTPTTYYGPGWRTLRLQPKNDGAATLPDWLLLDLFCVPTPANPTFYEQPHQQLGGLLNINAAIKPFNDVNGLPSILRPLPLQALLQGTQTNAAMTNTMSAIDAQTLATNIVNQTLTTSGQSYGFTNFFLTSGQLAEVKGVSDQGEASEALLRNVVDLTTTHGNVFTVYAAGQSIRQTPTLIQVLGERRSLIMLERDPSTTPPTWRTVFSATY